MSPRRTRTVVAISVALIGASFFFIHVCADGGAMGGGYRTCRCNGLEWVLYDNTAADGPRRTACLGWVSERTCYQSRAGQLVPCAGES